MEQQKMIEIDVEKIMEEIRAEIKEKGYVDDLPEFSSAAITIPPSHRGLFDMDEFRSELRYLNESWCIPAYRILSGNPVKVFLQKVIRKCTKFYVEPIVKDQENYNAKLVSVMNIMELYMDKMQEENEELKQRITQLEEGKVL